MNHLQIKRPLFIIGMPRSGTKLLRTLLNQHSRISIPEYETEFLPYLVTNWSRFGDLSDYNNFKKFYDLITEKIYFYYVKKYKTLISCRKWFNNCSDFSPADIFETLIIHDLGLEKDNQIIWGDKSPSYLRHVPIIKNVFPDAIFIHIIRDVRDYCLSINKAWKKNIFRASQRWKDDINKFNKDAKENNFEYLEIKYENLIENTEDTLLKITEFLRIEFDENMLTIPKAIEFVGDAKGKLYIDKKNRNKYINSMSLSSRKKIEKITASVLRQYNYAVDEKIKTINLSKNMMNFYRYCDVLHLILHQIKIFGISSTYHNLSRSILWRFKSMISS